ncbi:DUF805 domain-containing protein [Lactococcus lactis]
MEKAGDLKSYSNRSDYWWVFLTNSIIFAILSILNFMVTIPKAGKIMSQSATLSQKEIIQQVTDLYANPTGGALVIVIVTALIGLAILVPNISLTARRLRDARFPWWIALVFGVAAIYGLVTMFIHQDLLAKWVILLDLSISLFIFFAFFQPNMALTKKMIQELMNN